jgi:hypothetical protein
MAETEVLGMNNDTSNLFGLSKNRSEVNFSLGQNISYLLSKSYIKNLNTLFKTMKIKKSIFKI